MTKLLWDKVGERWYETGVSQVALYVQSESGTYPKGVAWSGITGITDTPGGAETTDLYADNVKYGSLMSAETYEGTIEAYTFPDEWYECDGSAQVIQGVYAGQQSRKAFGLVYKTQMGSDVVTDYNSAYKLHIVYNAVASPSEISHSTINDSPEAGTMSWSFKTTPVPATDMKPLATITIESAKLDEAGKANLAKLEKILYGDDSTEAMLPTPDVVFSTMKGEA